MDGLGNGGPPERRDINSIRSHILSILFSRFLYFCLPLARSLSPFSLYTLSLSLSLSLLSCCLAIILSHSLSFSLLSVTLSLFLHFPLYLYLLSLPLTISFSLLFF